MRNILFIISFTIFSTFSFADIKIGVIDLERAMNEVNEGASAKSDLKVQFDKKQKILDEKQKEIQKLQADFENQSAIMKPEIKQNKAMELQKKAAETQQLYMTMQQEMMKQQQDIMGAILQKMAGISSTLANEGKYDMILNKSETSVLFAKSSFDLTNEAIRRYDELYSSKKKSATKKK